VAAAAVAKKVLSMWSGIEIMGYVKKVREGGREGGTKGGRGSIPICLKMLTAGEGGRK